MPGTAYLPTDFHQTTQKPHYNSGEQTTPITNWQQVQLHNFDNIFHPINVTTQIDPTTVDFNVNMYHNADPYHTIALNLAARLKYYLQYLNVDANVFANNMYEGSTAFAVYDMATGAVWKPPSLKTGEYQTYDLKLVNLQNGSYTEFSANFCDFNTTQGVLDESGPEAGKQTKECDNADQNYEIDQGTVTFSLANYATSMNTVPVIPNPLKVDGYFFNPLTYQFYDNLLGADPSDPELTDSNTYNINYEVSSRSNANNIDWSKLGQTGDLSTINDGSVNGKWTEGSGGGPDYQNTANVYDHQAAERDGGVITASWILDDYYVVNSNEFAFRALASYFFNVTPSGGGGWEMVSSSTSSIKTSYKSSIFTPSAITKIPGLNSFDKFMTYKQPQKVLTNNDYTYLLYNSAQNFNFNSALVSSASVDGQPVTLNKNTSITKAGVHKIVVNFTKPNSGLWYEGGTATNVTFYVVIRPGYDFSKGIDAITYDPSRKSYQIYLDQTYTQYLELFPETEKTTFLFDYLNSTTVPVWHDFLTNGTFTNTLSQLMGTTVYQNANQDITYPTEGDEVTYAEAFADKVKDMHSTAGLVMTLDLDTYGVINNFGPTGVSPKPPLSSKYWDPILADQFVAKNS